MARHSPFSPATVTVNCKIVTVTVILTLNSRLCPQGFLRTLLSFPLSWLLCCFVSAYLILLHLTPFFGVFLAQLKNLVTASNLNLSSTEATKRELVGLFGFFVVFCFFVSCSLFFNF